MANTTEQALNKAKEALESCRSWNYRDIDGDVCNGYAFDKNLVSEALTIIEAASAEAAQPVAWMVVYSVYRTKHEAEQNVRNPDLPLVPLYKAAPQASHPIGQTVSGAGMTDERAKHDAWFYREYPAAQDISKGLYTMSLEGWKARALLSASGQAGASEAVTALRRIIGAVDRYEDCEVRQWVKDIAAHALSSTPAQQTEAPVNVPSGYVIAPHYRGFAHLGTGQYVINHSAAGNPAELCISIATEEQKAGRAIGEDRDNPTDHLIQPDQMCVRILFENAAGLDALEKQLGYLRDVHFPAAPAPVQTEAQQTEKDILDEVKTAFYHGYGEAVEDLRNGKPPVIEIAWNRHLASSQEQQKGGA